MSHASRSPAFEGRKPDWLTVDEARARVLGRAHPREGVRVGLADALGRALAERVSATATLPPWDNSAMDGYAVRAADVEGAAADRPVQLEVVGAVRAGGPSSVEVGAGEAVRIMTGAPIPKGADTVIRVEDTDAEADEGRVRILRARDRGRHVRAAGQDMMVGETLLTPGHTLTPGAIGLLAAAGCASVVVHRAPTVAILTTGDELRTPADYDEVREGRGVPDSNGPMLAALVRAAGAEPAPLGIAGDTEAQLREALADGLECDVLVTVGGASMGEVDLVKRVLDELGFEQEFWRVKMRPGSPIGFGWLPRAEDRQPVFSVPGNPGSAFVTFEVFVRPFLLALAGHRRILRQTVRARSTEQIRVPAPLTHFQRVVLSPGADGYLQATLTGAQGSGLVGGLARADGLAVVPADVDEIEPGMEVEVLLLGDGPADVEYDT
jgi:molybdopterin molybdotransferase